MWQPVAKDREQQVRAVFFERLCDGFYPLNSAYFFAPRRLHTGACLKRKAAGADSFSQMKR